MPNEFDQGRSRIIMALGLFNLTDRDRELIDSVAGLGLHHAELLADLISRRTRPQLRAEDQLDQAALNQLEDAGINPSDWERFNGIGDRCGCNGPCIGYHHMAGDPCGCLPVLIEDALDQRRRGAELATQVLRERQPEPADDDADDDDSEPYDPTKFTRWEPPAHWTRPDHG